MSDNYIIIDDMSYDEARSKIMDFIRNTELENFYPSDISDELNIGYFLTLKVLEDLMEEGVLEQED